jgi:molybdenum cofactor guanylyltransferase
MKAHVKHPSLLHKNKGQFAISELALVGATCSEIKSLAGRWMAREGKKYRMAYMDADHQQSDPLPDLLKVEANVLFTDKIEFFRKDSQQIPNTYEMLPDSNHIDLLLINGNHFAAAAQVLILDPSREKSILKRLNQLTNVQLILAKENYTIPLEVADALGDQISNIPTLPWNDHHAIEEWFSAFMLARTPPIKALILVGGQSQRMGRDKSSIPFHGIAQRHYLANLMEEMNIEPILSVQQSIPGESIAQLKDTFFGLGPMGAILSAFQAQPDVAWMVVACDMPYINADAVETLLRGRNPSAYATAFLNPLTGFADPLFTIYEPKSYLRLLHFMWMGHTCPRKMLINSDVALLELDDSEWLQNVNTPEELEKYYSQQTKF